MIKVLTLFLSLFFTINSFGKCYNEVWQNGRVRYTFTHDTLYIDEVGNEGEYYTYNVVGKHLYLTDALGYLDMNIEIYKRTKHHVWLLIDNKIYKFKRYAQER